MRTGRAIWFLRVSLIGPCYDQITLRALCIAAHALARNLGLLRPFVLL